LIEAISRVISEKGEVVDDASPQLAQLRSQIKIAHDRLQRKLEQLINDPNITRFLQENIITQRNGRYVVPLRAEHKGRFKSVVQDQSASGSTLFVEPLAVVELNNALLELQLAEKEEIHRILAELSGYVKNTAKELNGIVNSLAVLDLSLMCAKYAEELRATEPFSIIPTNWRIIPTFRSEIIESPPSFDRCAEGSADRHFIAGWNFLSGDHRTEHRWENSDLENNGVVVADGAIRIAYSRPIRF
jgi:dsDNA-specific endonuclease/ATPase MutS2